MGDRFSTAQSKTGGGICAWHLRYFIEVSIDSSIIREVESCKEQENSSITAFRY
jgi:hypothetical protein